MGEMIELPEPRVTERDLTLLMMSQDSLVVLGAMLGLQAKVPPVDLLPMGLVDSPAC
ncbi:MAG: hypothetical protein WCH13_02095 [Deltaproteobacteria bacterium]